METAADKAAKNKTQKRRVVVADFIDLQGRVNDLGRYIAEEFSAALAGAGKRFGVVDRSRLNHLMKFTMHKRDYIKSIKYRNAASKIAVDLKNKNSEQPQRGLS